jgi:hypothetical protein
MWYRVQVKRHAFCAWEDIHGGMDLDWAISVEASAKSDGVLAARVINDVTRKAYSF